MKPTEAVTLYTARGEALTEQPWQCHPRPLMEREKWFSLNGEWEFAAVTVKGATERDIAPPPEKYPERILVPFPPEALLSGIHRTFSDGTTLCYRKRFSLPAGF